MSLINDALRRASQSQQEKISGGPPLRPVEPKRGGGMGWILPAVIILLIAAAFFFIGMAMSKRKPSPVATTPEISPAQQVVTAPATAATAAVPVSAPASIPSPAISNVNEVAVISNSVPPPQPSPPPPPPPPQLKLQGIFYTPPQPSAIVNGKTVFVGDSVGDFTVKEITKNSVVLQNADGSEKKLTIGQ
jgi:hypothetical protein